MRITVPKIKWKIRELTDGVLCRLRGPKKSKYAAELNYWKGKAKDGPLANVGYVSYFTTVFGLDKEFYRNKKILDIGCGPRGSLEWADTASETVGLDPLVDSYKKLGASEHRMKYVQAFSEEIPFPDGHFDVVSSINSLDHVDDLDKTISEIIRVTAPLGCFLLLVEVNHKATRCEPITFSWDITERLGPQMELIEEKHYETAASRAMWDSLRDARFYDHDDLTDRCGMLQARFQKRAI